MKELLEQLAKGEKTVEDVLKAIDEADQEKVPRSRLNDKISEVKELEGQLKERDKQLTDLGKKATASEELTNEINRLKEENAETVKKYQQQIQQQAFDNKLADALRGAKAKNVKAVMANLDLSTIKLDGDKLLGLDDQLGALKESDAYLFAEEETPPGLRGRNPHNPQGQQAGGLTKEQFQKMSYAERTQLFTENPDQFNKLNS